MKLVHEAAARLWARSLTPDDRVLVIGATGWFGRTATVLLRDTENPVLSVASSARPVEIDGVVVDCIAWDLDAVQAFAPTVVVDCAFLTRDLVGGMTLDEYESRNRRLTANLLEAAALDSVGTVLTISSGAAVHPVDALLGPLDVNPYGRLKRDAEQELAAVAVDRGIAAVVARAWSVSGAFVQKPRGYAFSDMILQAGDGEILINAEVPVSRRYVSVEDLLAVALGLAQRGRDGVVDSGGPLVEMAELARAVAGVVNPDARIVRPRFDEHAEPNTYFASAESWESACLELGFEYESLPDQIRIAAAGLLAADESMP